MFVSLVGMSGSGKSYWSTRLVGSGFRRYCCDDLIMSRLLPRLTRRDATLMSVGEWMGFPHQPGYAEREQVYLRAEEQVLRDLFAALGRESPDSPVVLDTTGSVIYLAEALLGRLKDLTTVVHLATAHGQIGRMRQAYEKNPRPVVWAGHFQPGPGETPQQTLIRCYPALLLSRENAYRKLARFTVSEDRRRQPGFEPADLLAELINHHE